MTPEQFILRAPWRFAKTMPDQPHEYTVRGETPDDEFNRFVLYIREHGHRAEYRGRIYTYLEATPGGTGRWERPLNLRP